MNATRVTLEAGEFGWDYILRNGNGETVLIQTDWEYPSVAQAFGWTPCKDCDFTDGTVDCAHRTASEMILEARQYLDDHIGDECEDAGWFVKEVSR